MQLTQAQTEFVELLEAASSRVDQFVDKVLGPLVEAYGTAGLAPSRLPLDYVLNLAQLYLRLESVRQCEACRTALGVYQDGPVRTATEKASRILTLAALQYSRLEGAGGSVWLPEDLRRILGVAEGEQNRNQAQLIFQDVINEAASRYLIRTVFEAGVRLSELHYEQAKAFPAPLLGRGAAALAYAPLPYSDELQQQITQAREIVAAHFDALADEAIEDGGAGAKRVGLSRHYH
ncbi:MAG: hypothetical protein JNL99_04625 [Zoogloea sp.]|nr:hypothetical protein [Zoogloea sp.]